MIRDGQIGAELPIGTLLDRFRDDRYEIHVGRLPDGLAGLLPPDVEVSDDGTTLVVADGNLDAIYGVLNDLALHRVDLKSVVPVQPDLEDVFLHLVGGRA